MNVEISISPFRLWRVRRLSPLHLPFTVLIPFIGLKYRSESLTPCGLACHRFVGTCRRYHWCKWWVNAFHSIVSCATAAYSSARNTRCLIFISAYETSLHRMEEIFLFLFVIVLFLFSCFSRCPGAPVELQPIAQSCLDCPLYYQSRSGSRLGEVGWPLEYSTLLEGTQVVPLVSDLNQQEWMNKLHYLIAYCETVKWETGILRLPEARFVKARAEYPEHSGETRASSNI